MTRQILSKGPRSVGFALREWAMSVALPVGFALIAVGLMPDRLASAQNADSISYPNNSSNKPYVFTQGTALQFETDPPSINYDMSYRLPVVTSVTPNLPMGMYLNGDGSLGGTPAVSSPKTTYKVTVTQYRQSVTQTNLTYSGSLTITVNAMAKPTGLAYSTNPATYNVGTPIQPNTPSTKGGALATSYSINPTTMPPGLTFNSTTGVISGTPTAVSPIKTYSITANNMGGSSSPPLSLPITVNGIPKPSGLSYFQSPVVYSKITPNPKLSPQPSISNAPASTGGAVASYSISPSNLPTGLSFNTTTGIISGAPTVTSPKTSYTVTATNAAGSTTASLSIKVGLLSQNLAMGTSIDFKGTGEGDILWYDSLSGYAYYTTGNSSKATELNSTAPINASTAPGWIIVGVGDFDGDGTSDILWYNTLAPGQTNAGLLSVWPGGYPANNYMLNPSNARTVDSGWIIAGIGDFNGDGKSDVLWYNTMSSPAPNAGVLEVWPGGEPSTVPIYLNPANAFTVDSGWSIAGIGDFDGDGRSDVLWYNDGSVTSSPNYAGAVVFWPAGDASNWKQFNPSPNGPSILPSSYWSIAGTGDFDGDGRSDVLWYNTADAKYAGVFNYWPAGNPAGPNVSLNQNNPLKPSAGVFAGVGDYGWNGKSAVLWSDAASTSTVSAQAKTSLVAMTATSAQGSSDAANYFGNSPNPPPPGTTVNGPGGSPAGGGNSPVGPMPTLLFPSGTQNETVGQSFSLPGNISAGTLHTCSDGCASTDSSCSPIPANGLTADIPNNRCILSWTPQAQMEPTTYKVSAKVEVMRGNSPAFKRAVGLATIQVSAAANPLQLVYNEQVTVPVNQKIIAYPDLPKTIPNGDYCTFSAITIQPGEVNYSLYSPIPSTCGLKLSFSQPGTSQTFSATLHDTNGNILSSPAYFSIKVTPGGSGTCPANSNPDPSNYGSCECNTGYQPTGSFTIASGTTCSPVVTGPCNPSSLQVFGPGTTLVGSLPECSGNTVTWSGTAPYYEVTGTCGSLDTNCVSIPPNTFSASPFTFKGNAKCTDYVGGSIIPCCSQDTSKCGSGQQGWVSPSYTGP